ncbi:GNAT family N-acetyltransferase [Hoyosella rhizosphaerae]|uniref:GNAT family N-acetyltransferase n=1 Tax=Hoyosella rhizosphaerae TaxID=1755582 RepID=UPI00166AC446|nr:GNAT family N-acetyltransferase [Hoyosella rhizosphaerae]MBN4926403.1 GNAT family N-acetyltransferase [Hoyosella rhizosphaerae]
MFNDHARVELASLVDACELSRVAAITFPLACPPRLPKSDVEAFIDSSLSRSQFETYIASHGYLVFVLRESSNIVGYSLLQLRCAPPLPQCDADERTSAALSKFYLLPNQHGTGRATELMTHTLTAAAVADVRQVWLGVNQLNHRARSFYLRHQFVPIGARTFPVGDSLEHDFLLQRTLRSHSVSD